MDTKLKADIAESAVTTELLRRGFKVLKPFGDRLPYDLGVDVNGESVRIQVKSAWYDKRKRMHIVDVRRTKTNRRQMKRSRYGCRDFEVAIVYLEDVGVFYVMPVGIFIGYGSTISLIEANKRQRRPRSAEYRENWSVLSKWATQPETVG